MAATHVVHLTEPPREAPATGPLAAPGIARLVGFGPLALFGALHWSALLSPQADGTLLAGVAAAVAAAVGLLALGRHADRRVALAGVAVVVVGLLAVALLAAGVPADLLRPRSWDDLAGGLAQGMGSLPAITVPYRGVDEWVRIALGASGIALTGLAAVLAFWPRPGARTPGFPLAAAVVLGALYAIPIIQRGPEKPFFGGAAFCVLLATFLWLERLRSDQVGVGAASVLTVTVIGAFVAPRLDAPQPWLDYQALAEDLQPEKAATFSWDHSYGPMTWPRDGREVLRIKARRAHYWKTVNLDAFDGTRWVDSGEVRRAVDTEFAARRRDWFETIRVVDRGVRSREFIGAGHVLEILPDGPAAVSLEAGTFQTIRGPLVPGSSYSARVYVPRPSERQLRAAGIAYPDFALESLDIRLPGAPRGTPPRGVRFPAFGFGGAPDVLFGNAFLEGGGEAALRATPYARMYDLAQSLKADAATPAAFVEAVRERVQDGATYSESPPPSRVPLVDFMFRSRVGYCQQFSGAMALLLRMGGVPARVASGFSPGRFDKKRGEYIVRDDDAHSWVEAYFPGLGWQTFDPTPAASPARSQLSDTATTPAAGGADPFPRAGQAGDRPFAPGDPGAAAVDQGGTSPWLVGGLAAIALLLLAGAALAVRRGRADAAAVAPELAELHRALRRSGRTPPPGTTLTGLEGLLGGAGGYLAALRAQRYGGAPGGPTPVQRRGLRRDLAAGGGPRAWIRAWWALPPGLPERLPRRRGGRYAE